MNQIIVLLVNESIPERANLHTTVLYILAVDNLTRPSKFNELVVCMSAHCVFTEDTRRTKRTAVRYMYILYT